MPAAKRPNPSRQQPDFKRIKAKVGKRAPKKLNETETAFKAASIHVSGQQVENSSGSLVTARGRSIDDLMVQLGHPAGPVRLSAMKGVNHILSTNNTSATQTYLAMLLGAAARSCVDEDDSVRTEGLSVLKLLISTFDQSLLQPFLPLLAAYIMSGLHSLDRPTRIDGIRFLKVFVDTFGGLALPFAPKLIEPFVDILGDRDASKHRVEILESLYALVKNMGGREKKESKGRQNRTIHCSTTSTSSSVVLCSRTPVRSRPKLLRHLQDVNQITSTLQIPQMIIPIDLLTKLISKLRDGLLEVIQDDEGEAQTRMGSPTKLTLTVKCAKCLWDIGKESKQSASDAQDTEKLKNMALQVGSALVEIFPLTRDQLHASDSSVVQEANVAIAMCIISLKSFILWYGCRDPLDWLLAVKDFAISGSNVAPSVVEGLLSLSLQIHIQDSSKIHQFLCDLLSDIYTQFFQDVENTPVTRRLAVSFCEYRTAAAAAGVDHTRRMKAILIQIAVKLPQMVVSWGDEYEAETFTVLDVLLNDVRRDDDSKGALQVAITSMVINMVHRPPKSQTQPRETTLFESYSQEIQRVVLSLIALVGCFNTEIVNSLGGIVARSVQLPSSQGVVLPTIAYNIVDTVHIERKSIALPEFLGFLITSSGVATFRARGAVRKLSSENGVQPEAFTACDIGLEMVKASILSCGAERVPVMLEKLLRTWMVFDAKDTIKYCVQARAAVYILSVVSQHLGREMSVFDLSPGLKDEVVRTLCRIFGCCAVSDVNLPWALPVLSLLQAEPQLWSLVVDSLSDSNKASERAEYPFDQERILHTLVSAVTDIRLSSLLQHAVGLRESCTRLASHLEGSVMLAQCRQLLSLVDVHSGCAERVPRSLV